MSKSSPQISVLMSVYNSEAYLKEAMDSILNQTFSDFEFLIYEDGSQDSSLEILKEYSKQDSRIKLTVNIENKGLTANLIEGVNKAQGKYLARMDADDIALPERLEKQYEYLELNPEISVLGSSVIFFDDNGYEFIGYQPTSHEEIKVQLLLGFTLLHPTVMIRVQDFRKHNLNYNPEYRYAQDHDLWVRALTKLKSGNIYEPMLKMREHPNKISATLKTEQQYVSNQVRNFQLEQYQIELTDEEQKAFHNLSSGKPSFTLNELKQYERALIKIINDNEIAHHLSKECLKLKTSELFRLKCREFMISKRYGAWVYWKSALRRSDSLSFTGKIKFMGRSLICVLSKHRHKL